MSIGVIVTVTLIVSGVALLIIEYLLEEVPDKIFEDRVKKGKITKKQLEKYCRAARLEGRCCNYCDMCIYKH